MVLCALYYMDIHEVLLTENHFKLLISVNKKLLTRHILGHVTKLYQAVVSQLAVSNNGKAGAEATNNHLLTKVS